MRGSWKRGLLAFVAVFTALVVVSDAEGQIFRRRRNRNYWNSGYTTRNNNYGATYGTYGNYGARAGVGVTAPGVGVTAGPGGAAVMAPGVGVRTGPAAAEIRTPGANVRTGGAAEINAGQGGVRVRGQTPDANFDRGTQPPRDDRRDLPLPAPVGNPPPAP